MNPYIDNEKKSGSFIRIFSEEVNEEELVWHRDRKNRTVELLEGEGWKLQFDNALPIKLEKNKFYYIQKDTFHRIWRGKGDLKIKITES